MDRLLIDKDWEEINRKTGVDVMEIVVNLDNRYTPVKQAELIIKRCNLTSKNQDAKTLKAVGEWLALSAGYVRKIEIDQLKQGKMPE